LRVAAHLTPSVTPGEVFDLKLGEAPFLDAVVEAEIRNSSRPGSRAHMRRQR